MRMLFTVRNLFTGVEEMVIFMPYDPYKSMDGFYSRFYKRLGRISVGALGIRRHLVKIEFKKLKGKTDRATITFNNGASLDIPSDINSYDCLIIQKQLEVIMMKFKPLNP